MKPLKLVDHDGSILGAVLVPDHAMEEWIRHQTIRLLVPPDVKVAWPPESPADMVRLNEIIIVPSPSRSDAVMIAIGTLWDFEKCKGCFFIPGYALIMKGRR